ncbi:MAG: DUF1194 domain-containing protein [Pseudomonadota bacterium]|nr:DUF1194 domain-containing protein [Pseudomonadota bacterium]MEE3102020.1 DUF1194 domain-containing protein [Pseudomonadota bacterium]
MPSRRALPGRALALLLAAAASFAPAAAAPLPVADRPAALEVDMELILAVDISRSMDIEELRLQRDGYVAALRDPDVIAAAQGGLLGRIAVLYFEWAGPNSRNVIGGWTLIEDAESAESLAAALEAGPISAAVGTSISGALDWAAGEFDRNAYEGLRRVIDISGDGPNNSGAGVEAARDAAVAKGVTINGLPVMLKARDGPFSLRELDVYYEECVIGGPLAFVLPLHESSRFAETIRRKLILEIAGAAPPAAAPVPALSPEGRPLAARAIPAQAGLGGLAKPRRIDCFIGENRRRRWMENGGWEW